MASKGAVIAIIVIILLVAAGIFLFTGQGQDANYESNRDETSSDAPSESAEVDTVNLDSDDDVFNEIDDALGFIE